MEPAGPLGANALVWMRRYRASTDGISRRVAVITWDRFAAQLRPDLHHRLRPPTRLRGSPRRAPDSAPSAVSQPADWRMRHREAGCGTRSPLRGAVHDASPPRRASAGSSHSCRRGGNERRRESAAVAPVRWRACNAPTTLSAARRRTRSHAHATRSSCAGIRKTGLRSTRSGLRPLPCTPRPARRRARAARRRRLRDPGARSHRALALIDGEPLLQAIFERSAAAGSRLGPRKLRRKRPMSARGLDQTLENGAGPRTWAMRCAARRLSIGRMHCSPSSKTAFEGNLRSRIKSVCGAL